MTCLTLPSASSLVMLAKTFELASCKRTTLSVNLAAMAFCDSSNIFSRIISELDFFSCSATASCVFLQQNQHKNSPSTPSSLLYFHFVLHQVLQNAEDLLDQIVVVLGPGRLAPSDFGCGASLALAETTGLESGQSGGGGTYHMVFSSCLW
jgi:hypothetical protein